MAMDLQAHMPCGDWSTTKIRIKVMPMPRNLLMGPCRYIKTCGITKSSIEWHEMSSEFIPVNL